MAQSAGYGFAALAILIQLAIYCAIAFVIWKFYQMISKMSEDIAAIRAAVQRHVGEPELLDPDFQLPPDHPLANPSLES